MSRPSKARRLSALDASFLHIETRETPMHVGSLQVFQRPTDAPANFVKEIVEAYRARPPQVTPWNLKLERVALSSVAPAMKAADTIDMEYHVRHTALPEPGGERELGELVSHLHGELLDRSRPLWTCHVIEGLDQGRFAIYTKIHHALTDGVRGINMMARCLSDSQQGQWCAPWHWQRPPRRATSETPKAEHADKAKPATRAGLRDAAGVLRHALRPLLQRDGAGIRRPFDAPRSALNGPVTTARRVATQRLDMDRIKAIGQHTGTSLNDVFLTICSTALRRHLMELDRLPTEALTAGVPVSLRAPGDSESGNAIGFLWASLATDIADPRARLERIHASMQAAKNHLHGLPAALRPVYTSAMMAPAIAVLVSGFGARVRPAMNVTISNVPGPAHPLYLNGARLDALYPVSLPLQGLGLNITCISYAGRLNVGFTGSRDGVPHLQHIAVYASEALDALEAACMPAATKSHTASKATHHKARA